MRGAQLALVGLVACAPISAADAPATLAKRDARLAYQSAMAAHDEARCEEAINWATRCVAFDAGFCPCRRVLGEAYTAAGEAGELDPEKAANAAIRAYKQYIELCPEAKDHSEVSTLLDRLRAEHGPVGTTLTDAQAAHAAAAAAWDEGRHEDAMHLATRCVALDEHSCPCQRLLGDLYTTEAKTDRARKKKGVRHYSRYLRWCPRAADREEVLALLERWGHPVYDLLVIDAGKLRVDQPGLAEVDLAFARELYECVTLHTGSGLPKQIHVRVKKQGLVSDHRVVTPAGDAQTLEAARRCEQISMPPKTLVMRVSRYGALIVMPGR